MASATGLTSDVWSLERRLRYRLLVAITGLWLLGSALALYAQWIETNQMLDAAQEEMALTLLRLPPPSSADPLISALPRPRTVHSQPMLMQVYTPDGQLIWRTQHAPDKPLAPLTRDLTMSHDEWRIVVRPAPRVNRVAVIAVSLHDRRKAVKEGAQALLLPLLALLPLTALILTWLMRRVFRRIDVLRDELRARESGQLEPLSSAGLPRELQPLVEGLNHLFVQLTQVRQAERTFAANSAHELRTPIAAAQAQLQRLVRELHVQTMAGTQAREVLDQRVEALGRQLQRLHHLCVKLLQLSRADAGVARQTEALDLVQVAHLVLEEFNQPEQQSRLRLEIPDDPHAPEHGTAVMAQGDLDALGIALRNLIENALLHSGPYSQVLVRITPDPSIDVIDDGAGVPPELLKTLGQPFQRGESASPGHGLGLSIVNAIAQQMGGTLVLRSPHALGRGLHARLVLKPA